MKIQPWKPNENLLQITSKKLIIDLSNKMIKDIKLEMMKADKYNFEVGGMDAESSIHNEVFEVVYAYFHSVTFEMWRKRMQSDSDKKVDGTFIRVSKCCKAYISISIENGDTYCKKCLKQTEISSLILPVL